MFIFASYGVQLFGGKLARCNDPKMKTQENCTGVYFRPIHVTKLKIGRRPREDTNPKILVPRVW